MSEHTRTDPENLSPPQFQVVIHNRCGIKTVWEAHVRAAYVAHFYIHNMGDRRALMNHINHACDGKSLPLGEPDYQVFELPVELTALKGSVVAIRASWPSERELAL